VLHFITQPHLRGCWTTDLICRLSSLCTPSTTSLRIHTHTATLFGHHRPSSAGFPASRRTCALFLFLFPHNFLPYLRGTCCRRVRAELPLHARRPSPALRLDFLTPSSARQAPQATTHLSYIPRTTNNSETPACGIRLHAVSLSSGLRQYEAREDHRHTPRPFCQSPRNVRPTLLAWPTCVWPPSQRVRGTSSPPVLSQTGSLCD
jgi:hypothetical protein